MAQAAMALAESVREELERQRAGKVEVGAIGWIFGSLGRRQVRAERI